MMKSILICAVVVAVAVSLVWAQQPVKKAPPSPAAETSVTIAGKALSIKYSAPSVRGRQIFGDGGQVSKDGTYPVWRAGANAATAFHTEADLTIKRKNIPKGDYTVFVLVNVNPWQLIINKQIGQWGLAYDAKQDLVRIPMDMSKPPAQIETYKMTLSATGAKKGKLQLEWDNFIASVPITVK
jgi:hypothetical protein